jgi:hypothetical protein
MLLADVLVTPTGITTANVRDRRPWAKGFFYYKNNVTGSVDPANGTRNTATTNVLSFRAELSGAPVEFSVGGSRKLGSTSVTPTAPITAATVIEMAGSTGLSPIYQTFGRSDLIPEAPTQSGAETRIIVPPAPGSYVFTVQIEASTTQSGSFNTTLADGSIAVRELAGRNNAAGVGGAQGSSTIPGQAGAGDVGSGTPNG